MAPKTGDAGKVKIPHTQVVIDDGHIEKIEEFQAPEVLYKELIERVRKYHPSDDISLIEHAYEVASELHKEQVRKSGEPYIIHPLCVAIILADMEMDKETIAAGILHDVVEDTVMSLEELNEQFGEDVAVLVDGVTKLKNIHLSGENTDKAPDRLEMQAENLRKMFLAMAKDIRVILIKLADRLHNMRTLRYQKPESQQRIARETLEIYAPIAQRLGISKIKVELDDLSLKYLEPEVYQDLVDKIEVRKSFRERYIQDIVDEVSFHVKNAGIDAKIDGRVKHFFSIYKKMKNQNKTIDQIYDLFAVRVIVNTVRDCYAVLGVIHEMYKPIPGRFKDYISTPKPNMYQSLHTTLMGSNGVPFEIQIRTYDMHRTAEYGIAAHWKYKEASDGKKLELGEEEKLSWLKQILEWQQDMSDNNEFMKYLKSDLNLYSDDVYCFTPTGDVKNLPVGSTPIDFAYSIHSAVGNKMIGARVNGKLVTINYEIKNGDYIEILTSQNSKGPSRDWLNVVKSPQARSKINQWFKNEFKEDNVVKGHELVAAYCKAKNIPWTDIALPATIKQVYEKYGFKDEDSLYAAIGHGALKEGQVINRILEIYHQTHKEYVTDEQVLEEIKEAAEAKPILPKSKVGSGIIVKGIGGVAVRFVKCCNPLPGDEIVGFVTRGKGVSIHRTDCVNIITMPEYERERLIEAEWAVDAESKTSDKYDVEIAVVCNNRSGLISDISKNLAEKGVDILSMNTKVSKAGIATINIGFPVANRDEYNNIVSKLRQIESVIDVDRYTEVKS